MPRKYILILFALVVVISGAMYLFLPNPIPSEANAERTPPLEEEWKPFSSKRFTVDLPSQPHHAHETSTTPDSSDKIGYDMYVTQSRLGTTYMINVIEYPPSFSTEPSEPILTGILNDILSGNDSNQVMHKELGSFSDYPSIEFVLSNTQGNLRVRAFLRDQTLFILSVADTDIDTLDHTFARFVDSFRLLESAQESGQ